MSNILKYQNPSSPLLEKGYTTNNKILQDPDTFNVNWYKYRATQLQDAIKENPSSAKRLVSDLGFLENPKKLSNYRVINSVTNNFSQQLKDVKEFTTKSALRDHVGRTILMDEYYNKYPQLNSTNSDLIGPPKPITDKELEPILRKQLIKGAYWPQYNTIIYDSVIGNDIGTKIHERTHALINQFNPILNKLRNSKEFLRNKSHANPHYDDPEEIYARLMSIRKENNLDPTHIYTKDELHKMRSDKNFKDDFLINRYSDDFILMLLNDVAQNTTDSNRIDYRDLVNFVKKGGRIHIKKKNRGSFTRWCKGKVTAECIARGKRSKNPKIRKKAVFAQNSRRWRHELGGILQALDYAQYIIKKPA